MAGRSSFCHTSARAVALVLLVAVCGTAGGLRWRPLARLSVRLQMSPVVRGANAGGEPLEELEKRSEIGWVRTCGRILTVRAKVLCDLCPVEGYRFVELRNGRKKRDRIHMHFEEASSSTAFVPPASSSADYGSTHTQAHFANSNGSSSASSSNAPGRRSPHYFPLWLRISRLIFGKIRRLPRSMSTTLVLFTVHMYLTVPVIVVCGVTGDLRALLRPFRAIKAQGFLFEELDEQFCELL